MKLKKSLIVKVILSFITTSSLFGDNLESFLKNVLDNNSIIIENKIQISESNFILEETKGNLYPRIDLNYNYGYESNKNREHNNREISYKSNDVKNYSINLSQNIFRGYKDLYEIEDKKKNIDIKKYEKLANENKVLKEVLELYFTLYQNRQHIEILNLFLEKIKKNLILAQNKRTIVGTKDEYFSILEVFNKLNLRKLELEFDFKKKLELLKEFSNLSEKIIIKNYTFKFKHILLEKAQNTYKEDNPTFKASELNHLKSINLIKVSQSNQYPTLDLELNYYKDNKNSLNYKENIKKSAYIQLKYNVFNGFKDENNIKKYKLEILKNKNKLNEVKNKLNRELKVKYILHNKLDLELKLIKTKFLNEVKFYQFLLDKKKISNVSLLDIVNKLTISYETASLYISKTILKKTNYLEILYSLGNLKKEIIENKQLIMKKEEDFYKEVFN